MILELVLFLNLTLGEGVFLLCQLKLDSSKSVIISKELACFTTRYFITILKEKKLVPFGVKLYVSNSYFVFCKQ